jgi:2-hydroxychromene-2-carboxylate isomerase
MPDEAAFAAQSDHTLNRQFSRRWTGPPHRNRKPRGATPGASKSIINSKQAIDSTAISAAERAVRKAERRVREIERRAALLEALGLTDAALRVAKIAEEIRAVLE